MKTMSRQFDEIKSDIPINPFSILKASKFIKENSITSSEGEIGNWHYRTIMFKDGSITGWSNTNNTSIRGSLLTIFH